MKFVSTRGGSAPVTLSGAILEGIAPDGGLFVPERLPAVSLPDFPRSAELAGDRRAPDRAVRRRRSARGGARGHLPMRRSTSPLRSCRSSARAAGPACSSSFTARPARSRISGRASWPRRWRASAVRTIARSRSSSRPPATRAERWPRRSTGVRRSTSCCSIREGLVSARQAQQLACWGDNVRTFAVRGTFDDCQRLVKEAFRDPALAETYELSSANSINVGRLLPQMVYYAAASLEVWHREGRRAGFIVPSGNLGNVTAAVWAREAGLPIGDIVLATNANRDGDGVPRERRVASARERRDAGLGDGRRQSVEHGAPARAVSRSASAIASRPSSSPTTRSAPRSAGTPRRSATSGIRTARPRRTSITICTEVRLDEPWVLVETAHPAKFNEIVEPLDRPRDPGAAGAGAAAEPPPAGRGARAIARCVARRVVAAARVTARPHGSSQRSQRPRRAQRKTKLVFVIFVTLATFVAGRRRV